MKSVQSLLSRPRFIKKTEFTPPKNPKAKFNFFFHGIHYEGITKIPDRKGCYRKFHCSNGLFQGNGKWVPINWRGNVLQDPDWRRCTGKLTVNYGADFLTPLDHKMTDHICQAVGESDTECLESDVRPVLQLIMTSPRWGIHDKVVEDLKKDLDNFNWVNITPNILKTCHLPQLYQDIYTEDSLRDIRMKCVHFLQPYINVVQQQYPHMVAYRVGAMKTLSYSKSLYEQQGKSYTQIST